jgi:polysaccharide biosynthesis/export protein
MKKLERITGLNLHHGTGSPELVLRTVFSVLLGFASFAAAQGTPQNPGPPDLRPPSTNAQPTRPETNVAAVDPRTYVIGPEDVLFIRVWREQDFTAPYVVRPDGKITLPLVGDVQASGLTPERLADQIRQALSDFINKPDVTVAVQQVNSKKFYITGQVYRPGEFSLVVPTRVFDALSNAGGFRDFANRKKIVIIRGAQRLRFNYTDILKGKNLEQNVFLEAGDTIVVP